MSQGGRVFKKADFSSSSCRGKVKAPKKQGAQQQYKLQKKLSSAIHKRIEKEVIARAGSSSLKILK
jgi:Protein of unknown function (DUF2462)